MMFLLRFIGKLLAGIYAFFMFCVLILLVFMPIMSISDAIKIIQTGYTVTNEYLPLMIGILIMIYFSLRFRFLRVIYSTFPFLFETVKFLTITDLFIAVGTEVLNWSYITLSLGRNVFGIVVFIVSLILWRVFVSFYYYKKPLTNFIPKAEEKMQNYNEKV